MVRSSESQLRGEPQKLLAFTSAFPKFTGVFTGLKFAYTEAGSDQALIFGHGADTISIIGAVDRSGIPFSFFARCSVGIGNVYISSATIETAWRQLQNGYNVRYGSTMLPAMMLLKYLFGSKAWHSPYMFANLTIDDLPLRNMFGIDFHALLNEMKNHKFRTTIAYIPRSFVTGLDDSLIEQLFKGNSDYYSIVQHGDNHFNYEFFAYNSYDSARLCNGVWKLCGYPVTPYSQQEWLVVDGKAKLEALTNKIGFAPSRVMVFPYGTCPVPTLNLLKRYGYNATVHSWNTPLLAPVDYAYDWWMRPANVDYASFAFLSRTTPYDVDSTHTNSHFSTAVFNLFVGKPALFFSHGGQIMPPASGFDNFADSLNGLVVAPVWSSLDSIASRVYLVKANEDGSDSAWIFSTSNVYVRNDSSQSTLFYILKLENDWPPVSSVVIGGHSVPFSVSNGYAHVTAILPPNSETKIEFVHSDSSVVLHYAPNDMRWGVDSVRFQIHNSSDSSVACFATVIDSTLSKYLAINGIWINAHDSVMIRVPTPKNVKDNLWLSLDPFNVQPSGDAHLTGIADQTWGNPLPSFDLFQNYPNPFNPTTTIDCELAKRGKVALVVFNVLGQRVRKIADIDIVEQGRHSFVWDGENDFGKSVCAGVYYYQLTVTSVENGGSYKAVKKMLLLR